jgi:riboflavin kinase/FMN adenylyltransferase
MNIALHTDYRNVPPAAQGCVLAIGNFDGVHKGHRAVIETAKAEAWKLGARTGVVTFEPHPREFFKPGGIPFRLTLLPAKARLFEALGVEHLFAVPFNDALAHLSGNAFISSVLKDGLGARHVVVGPDFCFGHGRDGNTETLKAAKAFGVTVVPHLNCAEAERFSSTRIRALIARAEMEQAAELLGHPWDMETEVIPGDARGRTIGFPTANQDVTRYAPLPYGIYAVRVNIIGEKEGGKDKWRDGVANFGLRPMFEVAKPLLETYIFDFNTEIYGKQMRVRPVKFLRPELKLDGLEALKARIERDCLEARAVLKSASL